MIGFRYKRKNSLSIALKHRKERACNFVFSHQSPPQRLAIKTEGKVSPNKRDIFIMNATAPFSLAYSFDYDRFTKPDLQTKAKSTLGSL
ncbi:hypothetical protein CK510_04330 [Brunnivagina elsteri CCALA 953]|uniref:Uncharacterized protein n=1 Tax=Brunnivagina elsteri CCALA 953 TaxID=987040 RepID=A0A2A2TNF7_9CYAN|nr:hypothetical protein CK510_04330 [Calothrix elsteri CCALA 953]